MAIRFSPASTHRGQLISASAAIAGPLLGTHTPPPGRTGAALSSLASLAAAISGSVTGSQFPYTTSADGRYLIDALGRPVFIMGDGAAQALSQRLPSVVTTYLTNRKGHGFNALWTHVIINQNDGTNQDGKTDDGIAPFTGTLSNAIVDGSPDYDLTTPNPAYFSRLDQILGIAQSLGFLVLLDTLENDSFMNTYRRNGDARMVQFASYLANRYKSFSNVIWMAGNDFQTYTDPTDSQLAKDLMSTFASVDPSKLQTTELSYNMSGSSDSALLAPYTTLSSSYTYFPVYFQTLKEYNQATVKPVHLIESYYDQWSYGNLTPNKATDAVLRRISWWSTLSGALAGYYYGSIWYSFPGNWQTSIDTTAVSQVTIWKSFFSSVNFHLLVPDQTHVVVTAGYGTATGNNAGNVSTDNYVTAARTPDGKLVVAFCPTSTTLTVDMTKLSGTITARWLDPTTGNFTSIGSFANTGTHNFSTPGSNSAGSPDWVLVLTSP